MAGIAGMLTGVIIILLFQEIIIYKDHKRKKQHYKNIAAAKAKSKNFKGYSTKYY